MINYKVIDNYLNDLENEFEEQVLIEYLEIIYDEMLNIDYYYGYNKETTFFLNLQ